MSLRILYLASPVSVSPYLSPAAANLTWLPPALRRLGHTVELRISEDLSRDAADARLSGCYDVIHVHDPHDSGPRAAAGPLPLVSTSYLVREGSGVREIVLSRAQRRSLSHEPLAVIYPGVPEIEYATAQGDHLAMAFHGRDASALAGALAVARSAERELRVLLPAHAELSEECERVLESDAARLAAIERVDIKAQPTAVATASAYLSLERSAFDMGALVAMAAGTPVVTLERLPAAEVIVGGESGYVVPTVDGVARAVEWLDSLSPTLARERARICFSPETAAARLSALYQQLVEGRVPHKVPAGGEPGGDRGARRSDERGELTAA